MCPKRAGVRTRGGSVKGTRSWASSWAPKATKRRMWRTAKSTYRQVIIITWPTSFVKASNISETKQFEKIFLFSFCFSSADSNQNTKVCIWLLLMCNKCPIHPQYSKHCFLANCHGQRGIVGTYLLYLLPLSLRAVLASVTLSWVPSCKRVKVS